MSLGLVLFAKTPEETPAVSQLKFRQTDSSQNVSLACHEKSHEIVI